MERTGPITRLDASDVGAEVELGESTPVTAIGRFAVTGKLGEGGMGVVYAAHDADLDRPVAIKLLRGATSDPMPGRVRLLREARAMAKLSHPNVITIYDVGTEGNGIFIAMELVRGVNLRRWVTLRPRTWRSIIEVFVDAGRGLAAAHRAGIIHRDFKPDNVLVGEDGRVRVLDFGLARAANSEAEETPRDTSSVALTTERLTLTGAVIGTPAYMAPEQWRGGLIDERTDQFAYCVALWEALFGTRPFVGDVPTALAAKVMSGDIRAPTDPGDVPPWLVRVLRRGLSPDPNDRYAGMETLIDVLSRLRRVDREASRPGVDAPASVGPLLTRRYSPGAWTSSRQAVLGRDRLTRRSVAVQRLPTTTTSDAALVRLRALVGLHHPNIVTVLDHGVSEGAGYLVTEHHDGAVDIIDRAREQSRPLQLGLVAQLLRAVSGLHGAGLVHLQLSPRTIQLVDGQVKLHDVVPCLVDTFEPGADAAYVAPEVLLGEPHTPAADLFSVGVLAHEILTGRRPHQAAAAGAIVDLVLSGGASVAADEIEGELGAFVRRLLDPDPQQRFESADAALRRLVDLSRTSLLVETVETRESALRTARLAGRETELTQLVTAMRRCLEGAGESWLLGGESGIGKSRLLDELRAEAIARGAVVIRGQARADGGRPYEVWREVFRLLALACTDDPSAAVFAPVVPDLDALRGAPHKAAPALDAKSTQQRLARVVAATVQSLEVPLVILLDDLQWSGSESIDLLARLVPRLAGHRVMLIAGYRNDEAPDLPAQVPGTKAIQLGPLEPGAITAIAEAMTGTATPELRALLMRESEGNALLLVEVMRFLAEEAGDLHAVGTMTMPANVAAGGVRRAMRRRIERVEPWARPMLEVAAVAGRELDVGLLEDFVDRDTLHRALEHATACAVLEHDAGRWRFRHDKLREHLLAQLSDDRRKQLHRELGENLRRHHGESDSQIQALAHHFRESGLLADEARCSGLAGEQALANGAYGDAARLLARAIELRAHVGFERVDLVRWHRKLGEAHYVMGDLSRAVGELSRALHELGRPLPGSRIGWVLLLLRLVFVHVFLLALPGRFVARKPVRCAELLEGARAAGRIANLSTYSGDVPRILACSLLSANLAERAGRPSAYSLAVMGYSASYIGWRRLADRYFARASAAALDQDDPTALVEATQMECAHRLGAGDFERCKELLEAGYAAAERADYQLGLALAEGFIGQCEYFLGNFAAMLAHYARARELLTLRSPEHEHSFACGEAHALCMLGRFDEAQRVLARAAGVGAEYLLGEAFVLATRALVRVGTGGDALEAGLATNAYVRKHAIAIPPPCVHVLTAPAEAFVAAARSTTSMHVEAARTAAVDHAVVLRGWSKRNPVGEAASLLLDGQLRALQRDVPGAIDACERSLVSAKRLGLRFGQTQAELELGRLRGPSSVPGRGHLERARDLAARCGAAHYGRLVDEILDSADDGAE